MIRLRSSAQYHRDPDKHRECCRAWAERNPEQAQSYYRNYRALKHDANGTHTTEDIADQYARQNGKCYWCGTRVGDSYHVDHVIPLSRGGGNGPENLVIACPTCNFSKNARLPHEWSDKLW
jgi:5-methylcytosine-specific restriction endonuclease McrA